jgi:hypothetical protein
MVSQGAVVFMGALGARRAVGDELAAAVEGGALD